MNPKQNITKLFFKIGKKQGYTHWKCSSLVEIEYISLINLFDNPIHFNSIN